LSIRLIGANPFLVLYERETPTGYASVWRVDWSEQGSGQAIVIWLPSETRVIGADPGLAGWLADSFNRHFPEVRGLAWPEPRVTEAAVEMDLDLRTGMRASGGDVLVEIQGPPLDRRLVEVDSFDLGGDVYQLRTVVLPCRTGRLVVGGREIQGAPQVEIREAGAFSSAVLAVAEVWSGPGERA
jgi:hypothetical protein